MSWLSELFGGGSNITPPTAEQVNAAMVGVAQVELQGDPAGYRQKYGNLTPQQVANLGLTISSPDQWTPEQKSAVEAAKATPTETVADVQSGAPPPPSESGPPPYLGPTAREELEALLPMGFEQSAVGPSLTNPLVSKSQAEQRAVAQDFIGQMLRRGTLTESGRLGSERALSAQDPTVKAQLENFGNTLLGTERDKLRTLANVGRMAAGSQTGEFFDPTPYKTSVDQELAAFAAGLPAAFAAGAPRSLYSTAGLQEAGGAVTGPQNLAYDPYAVEGERLKTGVDEGDQGPSTTKRRSTSVF